MACPVNHTASAELNPAILPLDWLLGTWESEEPGEGCFPTINPFRYIETLCFSHVGQPVINFMFNAFHAESKKPLHRECGFIRIQPGTNRVAFIIAQNSGLVEIEEGELTGHQLNLQTHALARISFAKEPHVQQSVSAPTRWEAGADSFHGNRQPTADAAPAHHLPSVILTQQADRLLIHRNTIGWNDKYC